MMGNKKILILGAKGFTKVHCHDWGDENLPNIPDYNNVIINVVSLTNKITTEAFIQDNIRKGLDTLLDSNGTLVAIGCPAQRTPIYEIEGEQKIFSGHQTNYDWCPIKLNITNESGTSVEFNNPYFKEYFKNIRKWSYHFELPAKHKYDNVHLGVRYYSKNRYGKYLAGIINYFISGQDWKSGDFIFLPCPTEITDIEAINFILEKLFNVYQKTPPPEWTQPIEVPGLGNIQKNIESNLQRIRQISEETDKLKEKKAELINYRGLLYETGSALEEIIRKVFTKLGYKPKPPIFREEYIVEYDDKVGIIECKGNKKSIKRDDFRQLLDYITQYDLEGKFESKGILIGNAWRLKPLKERNKSETPIFPKGKDGIIDIAAKQNIALVSTIDIFNVFCKFLEGKIRGKDIMEKIFSAKGVVNFDI